MVPLDHPLIPSPRTVDSQLLYPQARSTSPISSTSSQFQTIVYRHLLQGTQAKLGNSSVSFIDSNYPKLRVLKQKRNPNFAIMSDNPQYQGSSSGQSGSGGKDSVPDPGVFDAILPRIETRGQSRSKPVKKDKRH
ncbi:hypothetical protein G7046_g6245 [Stylonectria norvegica]|nr:hypothetical protein G7046_g6245 [Stylonectria norvegica]